MRKRNQAAARERRAPMGVNAQQADRASRGRTTSSETPVHLRVVAAGLQFDRSWLEQRLGFKLGKFAMRIDRVDLTLKDESGPQGKPVICAIFQLRIPRRDAITVTARAATAPAAITAALRSCERTLRRRIERAEGKRTSSGSGGRLRGRV